MKYFWIILIALSSFFILQGCSSVEDTDTAQEQNDATVPAVEEDSLEIVEEVVVADDNNSDSEDLDLSWSTKVLIETDMWNMEAVLYNSTPGHRDNFIKLVGEWFYDGLLFHRVIQWFMIQWWDPESLGAPAGKSLWSGGPGYQIPAEIWAPHIKGTLAAARLWWPSNPGKESSGSQFYISQGAPVTAESLAQSEAQKWITYTAEQKQKYLEIGGVPMLDAEYTVFGEVTSGLDVIDKIAAVQTARGDRPLEDVSMKVSIVE